MTIAAETIAVSSYFVLIALLLGSFVNLAADRLPRRESLIRPGSHCRACGRRLNVVDLVPVAGYLLRRGRCASCGVAIGRSSLAVEAACGLGMLVPVVVLGLGRGVVVGFFLVATVAVGTVSLGYARSAVR
jgi:prepilin signal peptidase PulO-like enzyme (type II secretory pathway)